jgi:hypothetical protein
MREKLKSDFGFTKYNLWIYEKLLFDETVRNYNLLCILLTFFNGDTEYKYTSLDLSVIVKLKKKSYIPKLQDRVEDWYFWCF